MKCKWVIVCAQAIEDRDSRVVSLINLLERINFEAPVIAEAVALPFPAAVVTFWRRSEIEAPEEGRARMILRAPDDVELARIEFVVELMNTPNFRSIARLNALPFTISGNYSFAVELYIPETDDWFQVADANLELIRGLPDNILRPD
jgi:hypothetical protein